MRTAEEQADAEWPAVFFRSVPDSQAFALLAGELARDRIAGVWKFGGAFGAAKALILEHANRRDLEPTGQILAN